MFFLLLLLLLLPAVSALTPFLFFFCFCAKFLTPPTRFTSLSTIEKELEPLIGMVEKFVDEGGDCSFLHEHYHKLESRLCKEVRE